MFLENFLKVFQKMVSVILNKQICALEKPATGQNFPFQIIVFRFGSKASWAEIQLQFLHNNLGYNFGNLMFVV